MPLSRYQIRNEYTLADPDLYKVADKDDPEALLEGVAMAGLVGVLRQLGDLAEFAAEIFHDLHEEVMSTAARGHSLIVRVQQLEAEFPSIERTLLSQTSHTSFLYKSGIDWHPNARIDENVITNRDLPRFVMDSYEECRGPPRLFLLDKFDVAGAGACLKRFTDPSFFKAETTSSTGKKSDGQRERKTRRVKKRGPRWRNEDTPETFLSSHAKLHQLFLEELIETGGNDPDRRVKLKKRQFTGSLFDQEKTKSYMEKLLDACSPEQKIVHEVCIDALALPWRSTDGCESGLEIVAIGTVGPLKESRSHTMEMVVRPSLEGFSDGSFNDTEDGKISSAIYKVRGEEEFTDRERKPEVGAYDDGGSDGVVSDVENYMDAVATIESEIETDSESRRTPRYLNWKPIVEDSDASDGLRDLFYARSFGNSTTSEDSNNFFKERQTSSCSVSANTLAETTPDLDAVVSAVPPTQVSNINADNVSFEHSSTSEVPENKTDDTVKVANVETDETPKNVQEFGDTSNTSYVAQAEILPGKREESGHWSDAQRPMHDTGSRDSSICSESLPNPKTTHDGLLQIKSEKAYSVSSSVEEHSDDFRIGHSSAISYPCVPELAKTVGGDPKLDLCTSLTEESLDSEEQSETNPCQTPPHDCEAEILPSSQRYSSIKDVFTNAETEEKTSRPSIVGHTEILSLPISNGLQTCALESYFSENDDATEKTEYDSLEAAIVGVVSSGNLPNGELPFRTSDGEIMGDSTMTRKSSPVLGHDFTETAKQYAKNETYDEQKLVSISGDVHQTALNTSMVDIDASICQDVTLYSDQSDPVEAVEYLNKTETQVVEVDAESLPHENSLPSSSSSSSSICLEKVQDKHVSVSENFHHQSDDELTEDIKSRRNFNIIEAPLTSENGSEHLLEGMEENVHSLSHDLSKTMVPLKKVSYFQLDGSRTQPLVANQQIQIPEYDHGQSSMPILGVQSALHISTPSKVESTSFYPPGNLGQPIQSTLSFPVLGILPAEPHINIDSPPLPPLPPMQWRMSRFQNSSATTERPMVQQHISDPVQPMVHATNDKGTETFTDISNGASQPLTATISEVSVENSLDVIQRAGFSLASQPTSTSQSGTSISEEYCWPSVGYTSGHDSSVKEAKADEDDVQIQSEQISQITEQEAINSHVQFLSSSPVHYDWQPPPGLIAPEARLTWSSAYDGIPTNEGTYANGTQQKKLPRPRNPLIYEVVACDKSKLRKVERVKSPLESKPGEGESFLEQLQLRKVERAKPPVESKARERESPLEHIQLRKVGERVKSEVEQKLEGTESPRVQLRKVGEIVKSEVEEKSEETESLTVQLRKVSERVKSEVEQKPEETESPMVQLRKVGETVPLPDAPQIEDRDSILEQIRNKTFSLKRAVATRPNIQGPRTNLQVAAILEKASNIRQAMAGSDEEDDDDADSWNDS